MNDYRIDAATKEEWARRALAAETALDRALIGLVDLHEQRNRPINPIYRSGGLQRWHMNPDVPAQTLADHHGRVAQIVFWFWPYAPSALIYAALHHDCGEIETGDISSPAKDADQDTARALALREAIARDRLGLNLIDDNDPRLRFADRLEAYTYVTMKRPDLLCKDGWPEALERIEQMADDMGVSEKLEEWLTDR